MLNQEDLKGLLHYNEETGLFLWAKDVGYKIKAGAVAGSEYSGLKVTVIQTINGETK